METIQGVPTFEQVDQTVASATFQAMEVQNREFLDANRHALAYYRRRWVADPLHAWSRRWEYPFVFEALRREVHGPATVLDAGAGATFFPSFVAKNLPGTTVHAIDSDRRLAKVYESAGDPAVKFRVDDICALDCPDGFFDAGYSVSVLEHIPDRSSVASELGRVLKPGAPLVLTIDISLDGREEITIPEAEELLSELQRWFEPVGQAPTLREALQAPDALLTTHIDPADLPWNWSLAARAYRLLRYGKLPFRTATPAVTVHGSVWRRNPR
jgi:SAM-dependent methyltransferase